MGEDEAGDVGEDGLRLHPIEESEESSKGGKSETLGAMVRGVDVDFVEV